MAITSSDLWGSATTAITTAQMAAGMEAAMAAGETLYIERELGISGPSQAATTGGRDLIIDGDHTNNAGFVRTDPLRDNTRTIWINGSGGGTVIVQNLKFGCSDSGTGEDYKHTGPLLRFDSVNGLTVHAADFSGDVSSQLFLNGCSNFILERLFMNNTVGKAKGRSATSGATSLLFTSACSDGLMRFCHLKDTPHEMWKTDANSSNAGIRNVNIEDSFFEGSGREGIDTTGGWSGNSAADPCRIVRCIFKGGSGAFDFKTMVNTFPQNETYFPLEDLNVRWVLVDDCQFYNMQQVQIITTATKLTQGAQLSTDTESIYYWPVNVIYDVEMRNCFLQGIERGWLNKSGLRCRDIDNRIAGGIGNDNNVNETNLRAVLPSAVCDQFIAARNAGETLQVSGRTAVPTVTVPTAPSFATGPGSITGGSSTAPTISAAEIVPTSGMGGPWPVGTNFQINVTATGSPTPVRASTEWLIDNVVVSTALAYTATTATTTLKGRVTVSNSAGTSSAFTTAEITVTAAGALPSITGDTLTLLATAPT